MEVLESQLNMETILSLKRWEKREFFTWIPTLLHGSQKKLFRTLVVPFPFVCMLRPHLSIQNAWQQNFCRIKWCRTSNNMQHIPHFWKLWSASVSSNVISYQHWRKFQMVFFCLNTDYDFFLELQITFGALRKAVCSLCRRSLLCVLKACDMILKEKENNKSLHRNNVTPFSFWWSMRSFDFTNENNFNVIVWKHFIIVSFFWTVNTLQHSCR